MELLLFILGAYLYCFICLMDGNADEMLLPHLTSKSNGANYSFIITSAFLPSQAHTQASIRIHCTPHRTTTKWLMYYRIYSILGIRANVNIKSRHHQYLRGVIFGPCRRSLRGVSRCWSSTSSSPSTACSAESFFTVISHVDYSPRWLWYWMPCNWVVEIVVRLIFL